MMRLLPLFLALGVTLAASSDPYCPRYPDSVRTEIEESLALDLAAQQYAQQARRAGLANKHAAARLADSTNFIDQLIAKKMNAAGVTPARAASDAEFLRRVSLDLTGRIPDVDRAEAFLNEAGANKRADMIDELLASPAYADQLTWLFINRFKVTRAHESISTPARNVFYDFVHRSMAADRSYSDFARELISSAGEVDTVAGTQFFARWMDITGPIQDSWD